MLDGFVDATLVGSSDERRHDKEGRKREETKDYIMGREATSKGSRSTPYYPYPYTSQAGRQLAIRRYRVTRPVIRGNGPGCQQRVLFDQKMSRKYGRRQK